MLKAKGLNVKNMKETLVNYSGMQSELEKIWNTFYEMACLGFISDDAWDKFSAQCHGWYVTDDGSEVRDSAHDDKVIWAYTPHAEYQA